MRTEYNRRLSGELCVAGRGSSPDIKCCSAGSGSVQFWLPCRGKGRCRELCAGDS